MPPIEVPEISQTVGITRRDSGRVHSDERNDAELLLAVVDRDLGAMRTLHDRHAPWLGARLRRRCSDPDMVADALQETFLAVWRSAHRYDGRGEVAAWIWGIGIRQLIGRTRRRRAPVPFTEEALTIAFNRSGAAEALVSAEDRARRPARGADTTVARVAPGGAGDRARRAHHPRGGEAARNSRRNGQDTHAAGPHPIERRPRMNGDDL